jgi:hypothetical protein
MPAGRSHIRHRGGGGEAGAGGRSLGSPGLAVPVRWRDLSVMRTPSAERVSVEGGDSTIRAAVDTEGDC